MKPDPLPRYRNGYCVGCERFDVKLVLVDPNGRYRCEPCVVRGGEAPVLDIPEGGWKKCRACPKKIVFAKAYSTGKLGPYEIDDAGEWEIREGIAHHVGKPTTQLELGATKGPQRWTSHFARCPQADTFRRK